MMPLVNVPLSILALARMVRDRFDVRVINAVVDNDYREMVLDACDNALCLAVSSMTCYQIRDGISGVSYKNGSNIIHSIISLCRRAGICEVFFGFESGLQGNTYAHLRLRGKA
jgi:hypothetical protein